MTRDMVEETIKIFDRVVKERGDQRYPIYVTINSGGGRMDSGIQFIEHAKRVKNVHVIIVEAASMAATVSQTLSGKRFMVEDGYLMFHEVRGYIRGALTMDDLIKIYKDLKRSWKRLVKMSIRRSKASYSFFTRKTKGRDWYVHYEEARKLRFVDRKVKISCSDKLEKWTIDRVASTMTGYHLAAFSACPNNLLPIKFH